MGQASTKPESKAAVLPNPDVHVNLLSDRFAADRQGGRVEKFKMEFLRCMELWSEEEKLAAREIDISYNWISDEEDSGNILQFLLNTFPNVEMFNAAKNGMLHADFMEVDGTKIRQIDFSSNSLQEMPMFSNSFANLSHLNVSKCGIVELPDISDLKSLKSLDISQNRFTGEFFIDGGERTLTELVMVGNNNIDRICGLNKLEELIYLNISFCAVKECVDYPVCVHFRNCDDLIISSPQENVEFVDVSFNAFSEFPDNLFKLKNIVRRCSSQEFSSYLTILLVIQISFEILVTQKRIVASNTLAGDCRKNFPSVLQVKAIADTITSFTWCMNGDVLHIPSSELDLGFSACSKLEELRIRATGLLSMPEMTLSSLRILDLAGNNIEDIRIEYSISERLPSLKVLSLTSNNLKSIPESLRAVAGDLKYLSLQDNPFDPMIDAAEKGIQGTLRYLTGEKKMPLLVLKGEGENQFERLRDKIMGVVFGCALGDCVGVFTEFLTVKGTVGVYDFDTLSVLTPPILDRHRNAFVKDWTDDTDQLILIMRAMQRVELDGEAGANVFGRYIKDWSRKGFPELGDLGGSGIGFTTRSVLYDPRFDKDPKEAAKAVWEKLGKDVAPNGGVMRCAISGCLNFEDIEKVIDQAKEYCSATHYDARCNASAVAVSIAVAMMLKEATKDGYSGDLEIDSICKEALEKASDLLVDAGQVEFSLDLEKYILANHFGELALSPEMIGYTFKTLGAGFYAFREGINFVEAIRDVVMRCGDADTNAAVAGALVGCRLGYSNLPMDWVNALIHKDWLEKEVDQFLSLPYFEQYK